MLPSAKIRPPADFSRGDLQMSRLHHPLSWRRHPWRFFAAAFVAVLAVAGAERFAAQRLAPGHGARWIWAPGDLREGLPIAFYAARDVELEEPVSARLAIVADETYVLYVNGRRLGSGSYRTLAPVDEYEIGDFLEAGTNRIVIELRSCRGAGGLLAELEIDGDAARRRVVGTGADWRIFRRHDPALFGGWSRLDGGEPPQTWQRPPTGRWRLGETRARRPTAFRSALPPPRRRPVRVRQQHRLTWHPLDWERPRVPALGPHQLYDWGEEVEGFLAFDLASDEGLPGLLYFGSEPPDPQRRAPDEIVLPIPGRGHWEDAHARRFRYVLVVGAEPYSRMDVERAEPGAARDPEALAHQNGGVFGLEPTRSYSQTEEDVWKRLGAQGASIGSKASTSSSAP